MLAPATSLSKRIALRVTLILVLLLCILASTGIAFILSTKKSVYQAAQDRLEPTESTNTAEYFPVGIDPVNELIIEQPTVDGFLYEYLAYTDQTNPRSWWYALTATLANYDWYQQLASPVSRIIVIWPGERTDEVAETSGAVLRWDRAQRDDFISMSRNLGGLPEGTLFPGRYVTHRYASPAEIALMINDRFQNEIIERYPPTLADTLPLAEVLTIASLLEREARDFTDMREISGIIWNRLFIDMPLQLDATLQYVKANERMDRVWWPVVRPADKFLDSPFNTYQHAGLPPSPIANPSPEAILAALNPKATTCYFYFHDTKRNFYCSDTYEEHVEKLKAIYGRGS